jgi:DNA phosphorothioation-dependent restriction protein DptH
MQPVQELTQAELNQVLTQAVKDLIIPILVSSRPGHCLRISSLSESVMRLVCAELNQAGLNVDIVFILSPRQIAEAPWQISATRLIELRNEEKRPLLAFIPPGLKAAAEDSFDISTFAEIDLGSISKKILQQLRQKLPSELGGMIDRVISSMRDVDIRADELIRYYLTVLKNDSNVDCAGGAIYQLGLVPDFALYQPPALIEIRVARNLNSCRVLQEGDSSLLARIHNLRLKANSLQSDLYRYLRSKRVPDIRNWGSELANDPALHHLCFDQWPFEGEERNDKILIFVDELGLKARDENAPLGPDNPPYLDVNKASSIKISWITDPKPNLVPEIKYYRIEIIGTEGDLVAWESRNIPVSSNSKRVNVKEFRDTVEDGLYYFRVRAYSEGGELLNFEDHEENPRVLRDPYNPGGKRINTSEDVWFWKDPNGEPPPVEAARNVMVNSFLDAQLQVRFAALDRNTNPFDPSLAARPEKTGWFAAKGKSAEANYQIGYDAQTKFTLPVSSLLREIENDTLKKPENLGRWRLSFSEGKTYQTVEPVERQFHNFGQVPEGFLQARRDLFAALQGGNQQRLVSTIDLTDYSDLILIYVQAYQSWLEGVSADFDQAVITMDDAGRRRTEAVLLDIDTVQMEIPNDTAINDRVYLIAPTHPLRLLWHLQRAMLAKSWLEKALQTDQPKAAIPTSLREFLRRGLAPMNLPPFLRPTHESFPYGVSRFYVEQGPLTPFWSLYLPEDVRDRRALFARVKRALAIKRSSTDAGAVGGVDRDTLVQKIQRYLFQHPYVETLKINAFNPGDASLLVDAILKIEKDRREGGLSGLRYELRLFTQGSVLEDVGDAVEDLVNPERQVSPEADAFSNPSQNHLFPKLRFYRNQIDEFLEHHEQYQAHLSLLHDVFPVDVDVDPVLEGRSSFLHGLIQDPITTFGSEAQADYAWQRQLHPGACPGLTLDDRGSVILAATLDQLAALQASVAVGKATSDVRPTLHLRLRLRHKNLLNLVHKTTDWVFIIDRNLGLEYFDSGPSQSGAIYLLDFVPEFASMDTDRLFLTTQVTEEITGLIRPTLEERDLDRGDGVEIFMLNLLRSLSGRLALKLLSTPTDVSGVLGLALARLFLEQFGLLEDCILIPIDSHIDLFTQSGRDFPLADEVSFKRGDLLLVSGDPKGRTLHFNIIEVKLRSDLGDINAYLSLRQDIEAQLTNTDSELRKQFDPHFENPDRIDRQVKTRELIALLAFYLQRSQRYGLVSQEVGLLFSEFIQTLDQGYKVAVAGLGLIFDFGSEDLTVDEEHAGLVFYRIGKDYLQRLVDAGLRQDSMLQDTRVPAAAISEALQIAEKRQEILSSSEIRKDSQYERVRTIFRKSTAPKSKTDIRSSTPTSAPPLDEGKPPQPESATPIDEIVLSDSQPVTADQPITPMQPVVAQSHPTYPTPPVPSGPAGSVPAADSSETKYDVLIGDTIPSPQYGIIGKAGGKLLALDLNGTNTISLFGVQGGGKSYTVGTIVEMATQSLPGINHLPGPLATVIFHYHESQDYPPEFVSMVQPNTKENEIKALMQEYGAQPAALQDMLILTSADKLPDRRVEFPGIQVEPISFSSRELSFKDWRFLMGVGGNQMYVKQINMIMRQLRGEMTLDTLRAEIEGSDLSDQQKTIANIRLNFASQFIDDERHLAEILKPGRLIIVDLRDEFIDKDEALGLFVVMLNIFANAGHGDGYNKLIVFDEAHKYMDNPDLTSHIVDVIRQMRHQGVSVLIASQDPPSLPNAIIELSSLIVLHRFNSPQWLRHIQKSITALSDLTPQQMAALTPGEAFVWATKSTERIFTQKAVKIRFRPRLSQHGGSTKTAV